MLDDRQRQEDKDFHLFVLKICGYKKQTVGIFTFNRGETKPKTVKTTDNLAYLQA